MRQAVIAAVLGVMVVSTGPIAAGTAGITPAVQEPTRAPQVFRSTADLVPIFVTVSDKAGRLVAGLMREDFQVLDNGKPQPLTLFDNRPQPIRVVALLDISGSVARTASILRQASTEFILQLTAGDLARIGTIAREVKFSPAFTRDPAQLVGWLPTTIPPGLPMPLWNAVDAAITQFDTAPPGRRVVLVFSGGQVGAPQYGEKVLSVMDISERAQREDVMIYGVGIKTAITPIGPGHGGTLGEAVTAGPPDVGLSRAADNTGGGYFELLGSDDLGNTFGRVANELHHQYLLGFAPPARDGKTHKIEVRVRGNGLKARARKTYAAPAAGR